MTAGGFGFSNDRSFTYCEIRPIAGLVSSPFGCRAGLLRSGLVSSAMIQLLSLKRWTQYPHPRTVSDPRRTVAAALSSDRRVAQWGPAPSRGKGGNVSGEEQGRAE